MILLWSQTEAQAYPLEVAETLTRSEIQQKQFNAYKDTDHGKTGPLSKKLHEKLLGVPR